MKKNIVWILLIAIILIAAGTWYFMRPVHYCEVVYKENPSTKKLEVSCDAQHCDKTCYMKFRKKDSEDDWRDVPGSHEFDSSKYEYKCLCK